MSVLYAVLYLAAAFTGAAVVFQRRPINQLFVFSLFGTVLTLLFFALHAPDVALSELAVGTVLIPVIVLIAIMKTGRV